MRCQRIQRAWNMSRGSCIGVRLMSWECIYLSRCMTENSGADCLGKSTLAPTHSVQSIVPADVSDCRRALSDLRPSRLVEDTLRTSSRVVSNGCFVVARSSAVAWLRKFDAAPRAVDAGVDEPWFRPCSGQPTHALELLPIATRCESSRWLNYGFQAIA
jgi:hypothetical protein